MYHIALKESPTLLRVTENKNKISSSHPMVIRGRRSREASITKKGCTRWWEKTYFYSFFFLHVAVAVLFVISKFVLCLLSTHFVLCFFDVTNIVFTCPLSCSEDLEVIVIVCDSLVSSSGRVVTIIIVIVYNSLVRRWGRVAAWTDGTVPGGGGAGRGPGTTPGQE